MRVLCSRPSELLQLSQSREVEFFGARDGATMTCDPLLVLHATTEAAGLTHRTTCRGDDGSAALLERTVRGRETIAVGGRQVEVVRVSIDTKLTGRTTGSAHDELWLLATNGLTVRWDRQVDTVADAAFGARVRYREDASFVLESLEPAT